MTVIALLDPAVANQIAAGEVVERPASVVKELVENSLDAGATRITLRLEDGGRKRIVVTDNGCGMSADDAPLAFARHATSKLQRAEQLQDLHTFGFRGEALASILSVSRVTLQTRRAQDAIGICLEGAGGVSLQARPVGCPVGTSLEVADLFWNVPARQKFLRTAPTELGQILRFVEALALARPDLHLTVLHNGKKVVDYTPDRDLAQRAFAVFGKETAKKLYPVGDQRDYAVQGLLSEPGLQITGPGQLVLLVQGRPVSDRTLLHAVVAAYGPLLERGKYPTGVLSVECPPGQVDVNVHPQKTEVRFVSAAEVHAAVHRAVRPMLAAMPWLVRANQPTAAAHAGAQSGSGASGSVSQTARLGDAWPAGRMGDAASLPWAPAAAAEPAHPRDWSPDSWSAAPVALRQPAADAALPPNVLASASWPHAAQQPQLGQWQQLRYVGQVGQCFLVCEDPTHFVLIDQHAAHERVLFERYVADLRAGDAPSQRLLVPQAVTLPPEQIAALLAEPTLLQRLGFAIEQSGPRLVRILAAPAMLRGKELGQELAGLAAGLLTGGQGQSLTERLERTAATLACHAAFRAGDVLQPEAVQHLLAAMQGVDLAGYCPHGRPAVLRVPLTELGRFFAR